MTPNPSVKDIQTNPDIECGKMPRILNTITPILDQASLALLTILITAVFLKQRILALVFRFELLWYQYTH